MNGTWIVTQTHKRITTHHEVPSKAHAILLSDQLEGIVEIAYQGTLLTPKDTTIPTIPTTDSRNQLLLEAAEAHHTYTRSLDALRINRYITFKQAAHGHAQVRAKDIAKATGLALRSISHIINNPPEGAPNPVPAPDPEATYEELAQAAIDAHHKFADGAPELKAARHKAFRRAYYSNVNRNDISNLTGLTPNNIQTIATTTP